MKKFDFELQSILNLKEQEEKAIQKELIELKNKYQKTKEDLEYVKERKENWQIKLHRESKEGISSEELKKYHKYINYLNNQIEELSLRLEHWKQKVNECQQKLLKKVKEKKTLSKLKERKYEKYWEDFLREEQKLNDEIAINNFNH